MKSCVFRTTSHVSGHKEKRETSRLNVIKLRLSFSLLVIGTSLGISAVSFAVWMSKVANWQHPEDLRGTTNERVVSVPGNRRGDETGTQEPEAEIALLSRDTHTNLGGSTPEDLNRTADASGRYVDSRIRTHRAVAAVTVN